MHYFSIYLLWSINNGKLFTINKKMRISSLFPFGIMRRNVHRECFKNGISIEIHKIFTGRQKYQNAFWLKGQQKEESKLSKQGLLISTTEISLHFGWMNALAPNLKIIEAQSSCVCEYAFNCFFFLSFGFVIILFLDASYKMWDAKQVVGWPPRKIRIIARPRQIRFFPVQFPCKLAYCFSA